MYVYGPVYAILRLTDSISPSTLSLDDQTQVIWLGRKPVNLLSHITSPLERILLSDTLASVSNVSFICAINIYDIKLTILNFLNVRLSSSKYLPKIL